MSIEYLKLILETIGAAGEGAFTIFVIWIGIELITTILWAGLAFFVAWLFYKVMNKTITGVMTRDSFSLEIARMFGENHIDYPFIRASILGQIRSLQNKDRERKKESKDK